MRGSFAATSSAPVSPELGSRGRVEHDSKPRLIALAHFLILLAVASFIASGRNPGETRSTLSGIESHQTPPMSRAPLKKQLMAAYGKLPLGFEANSGQTDPKVKFVARGRGYSLFLTQSEAVLTLQRVATASNEPEAQTKYAPSAVSRNSSQPRFVRMKVVGANPHAEVIGIDELPGKINYFAGRDPKNWHTNVSAYKKVRYEEIYPGISLVYYGNQQQLEYDFVVAPGSNPNAIVLRLEEAGLALQSAQSPQQASARMDENGDLVLGDKSGEIRFRKPLIYQASADSSLIDPSHRKLVEGGYILGPGNKISFRIASYDRAKPLIIDPILTYSTYFGGTGNDSATAVTVDATNSMYFTGTSTSLNFPTSLGAYQTVLHDGASCSNNSCGDAFVTKLDPTGTTVVFSTYLGGSGQDIARAIAVDSAGNSYIAGSTNSLDFPIVSPVQSAFGGGASDGFVAKVSPTGSSLIYSTYLGGNDLDQVNGIAIDSSGDAFVVGGTQSANFAPPTSIKTCQGGGILDAFVTELDPAGSGFVYNTCLGGSGSDVATGVALNSSGNAYVVGTTSSANFPTTSRAYQKALPGSQSAFVALLATGGSSISYATFLGGSASDSGAGIAVDAQKFIYVTGTTTSSNFPVTSGAFQSVYGGAGDAFIAKLNSSLSGAACLVYSTYVGGSGNDSALGIALDGARNVYIAGYTTSADLPLVSPVQSSYGGSTDAFVFELNYLGTASVFSTYLGGSGAEDQGGTGNIAVDSQGNAYVVGSTTSSDFPIVDGTAIQPSNAGATDAFIAKLGALSTPVPGLTLLWPLPTLQNRGVVQEQYSEYNFVGNHMFHTGLSLLAPAGTTIGAAAGGDVVLIQLNPPKGSTCYDHGYGNTVFIQHTLPNGSSVYSQYSHMLTIDPTIQQQCGTPNSQYQITCSVPVPVTALQTIGTVGHTACGYGDTNPSDTHLHLELKNFLALVSPQGPGGAGYVTTPPDQYGLFNPIENLHTVENLQIALPVVVTGSASVNLLSGPGGGGGTAYRSINQVAPGVELLARRMVAGATSVPACSSGWYEVGKLDGTLFTDTFGSGTGQMLYAWVCGDNLTPEGSAPPPPQPVLSLSGTSLTFNATQGSGTNPAPGSINVTNTGTGTLNFTATSDSAWLGASPTSGTAPQSLQISATLGSLTAGTYTGHITVTSSGANGSPATITVTFVVAPPQPPQPILSLSGTSLTFNATQGSGTNPAPGSINVTNTGTGTLNFTATSDSAWLGVSPASGTAPQSLQISATLGSLTAGNIYRAHYCNVFRCHGIAGNDYGDFRCGLATSTCPIAFRNVVDVQRDTRERNESGTRLD